MQVFNAASEIASSKPVGLAHTPFYEIHADKNEPIIGIDIKKILHHPPPQKRCQTCSRCPFLMPRKRYAPCAKSRKVESCDQQLAGTNQGVWKGEGDDIQQ